MSRAQGHVRLWAYTSAVNGILPEVLARVLAQHPGTHIALQEALSDAAARAVASGAADLGIFGENTAAFGLVTSVCDVHDLVLLVPQKHPLAERDGVSFAEALQFDFIGQERESSLVRLMAAAEPLAQSIALHKIRLDEPRVRRRLLVGRSDGTLPPATQAVLEAIAELGRGLSPGCALPNSQEWRTLPQCVRQSTWRRNGSWLAFPSSLTASLAWSRPTPTPRCSTCCARTSR